MAREGKRMDAHQKTPGIPVKQPPYPPAHAGEAAAARAWSRRHFLTSATAGLVAGAVTSGSVAGPVLAAHVQGHETEAGGLRGRRILLKGGVVLSLDPSVGDFE